MRWRFEPDSFIEAVAKLQGAAEHVKGRASCLMCPVKTLFSCVGTCAAACIMTKQRVCACVCVAARWEVE